MNRYEEAIERIKFMRFGDMPFEKVYPSIINSLKEAVNKANKYDERLERINELVSVIKTLQKEINQLEKIKDTTILELIDLQEENKKLNSEIKIYQEKVKSANYYENNEEETSQKG